MPFGDIVEIACNVFFFVAMSEIPSRNRTIAHVMCVYYCCLMLGPCLPSQVIPPYIIKRVEVGKTTRGCFIGHVSQAAKVGGD